MTLAQAAHAYAEAGLYIFPLRPYQKTPKLGSHGFKDASRDRDTIAMWWGHEPESNIGIDCGRSGLLVVDVDPRNDGDVTWRERGYADKPWLQTPYQVTTPSGGRHYYFRMSTSRLIAKTKLGPGIDIQAVGGYVIAPPSQTLAGEYMWVAPRA